MAREQREQRETASRTTPTHQAQAQAQAQAPPQQLPRYRTTRVAVGRRRWVVLASVSRQAQMWCLSLISARAAAEDEDEAVVPLLGAAPAAVVVSYRPDKP